MGLAGNYRRVLRKEVRTRLAGNRRWLLPCMFNSKSADKVKSFLLTCLLHRIRHRQIVAHGKRLVSPT
jgi:hypothetical protein